MGCEYCKKKQQIVEEVNEVPKEEKIESDEFDFKKGRYLVKLLLAEDKLYKKALNYVFLFNDEQFLNLFQGNRDYKNYPYNNIQDQRQFKNLLLKFEDKNEILYEFYKDETKYVSIIKLWNSQICVNGIVDLSMEKLDELLEEYDLVDINDFIFECLTVMNNSTNKKAFDVNNYLRDTNIDFYSLIQVTNDYQEEFEKTKLENKEVMTINLENISKKLIEKSMPFIKDYIIKSFPNLNAFSKMELKSGMLTKLKDNLFKHIKEGGSIFPKGISFDTVSKLVNRFQSEDNEIKILSNEGASNIVVVANSFLNLATSIKCYYDDIYEYDETNKKYTEQFEALHKEFEALKKNIEILDLDNYEESMEKIIDTGKKMNIIKQKIANCNDNMTKEEQELKEEKTGTTLKRVASAGVSAVTCAIGSIATGGVGAVLLGAAAVGNAINFGVNIVRLRKLYQQLNKFKETKDKESKSFVVINAQIDILRKKCEKIHNRYIPPNLFKD